MVITFEDKEQLQGIISLVNMMLDIYEQSSNDVMNDLASRLHWAYATNTMSLDFPEDSTDNHDNNQVHCLYNIVKMVSDCGADEVDAACSMYKVLKKHCAKSDVPRFLEMLKKYNVPAEYCTELFRDWCSNESLGGMAIKCMDIQNIYSIIMTPVWEWILNNSVSPDTDWHEEMNKYKEAINGCSE